MQMPLAKARLVLGLSSCLTILACGGQEAKPPSLAEAVPSVENGVASSAPRELAISIEASKSTLRSDVRTGKAGESGVIETRYYVGNTLVLVEEVAASSATGQSDASYYLDDDRLAFFRARGTRTTSTDDDPFVERYAIELGFDTDGNLVDAIKLVNGVNAALDRFDVEAPKARARMLALEDQ